MRREMLHLFGLDVEEINIGVGRGFARFTEGDEFAIVRDVAELKSGFVFVNELRRKIDKRHFIDVEKLRVARVGREEERFPVLAPREKIRFRLLARSQVALRAVERS